MGIPDICSECAGPLGTMHDAHRHQAYRACLNGLCGLFGHPAPPPSPPPDVPRGFRVTFDRGRPGPDETFIWDEELGGRLSEFLRRRPHVEAMLDAREGEAARVAAAVARTGMTEPIPTVAVTVAGGETVTAKADDPEVLALRALFRLHDTIEEELSKAHADWYGNSAALAQARLREVLWPIHDQLERDIIAVKAALGPARLAAIEAAMEDES